MLTSTILNSHTAITLRKEISKYNKIIKVSGYSKMKKADLVNLMMKHADKFKYIKHAKTPTPAPRKLKPVPAPRKIKPVPAPRPKAVKKTDDKPKVSDAKAKSQSEVSRARLTERFTNQADKRKRVLEKKKKEKEIEQDEKETDKELEKLKGKKLKDKIQELTDNTSDDDERARIYFKFGTPAILKSKNFKGFLEQYIEDSNLNEDNNKLSKKEMESIVYNEFRKEWERTNPNRDFFNMMKTT